MSFNGQQGAVKMAPLMLQIPAVAMAALEKAAAKKGFKPSHYAQMLFDAAFAARVGIDKRQTPLDREMDEQVRLVFAHAGQGTPAAIGRAIGMPADRVERILAAWQHAAGGSTNDSELEDKGPLMSVDADGDRSIPSSSAGGAKMDEGATPSPGHPDVSASGLIFTKEEQAVTTPARLERVADATPAPPPPRARAPQPAKGTVMADLTERQSAVFIEAVRRIDSGEVVNTDLLAAATGLRWNDVSSAFKTLMGRALLARKAGTFVLTARGAQLAADHMLSDKAA